VDTKTAVLAGVHGHLDCFQYALQVGCALTPKAVAYLREHGSESCVAFAKI
jgi:hypothetical protein